MHQKTTPPATSDSQQRLETVERRFETQNRVTTTAHSDEEFENVRDAAARHGFALEPGTIVASFPQHIEAFGGMVTSHVAHWVRSVAPTMGTQPAVETHAAPMPSGGSGPRASEGPSMYG